ncbi:MAG TPA: pantoate--beta-alanine ligase [Dongiaceae bacterium]
MRDIEVVRSVAALRAAVYSRRKAGLRIGLVPTMGALHDGHLALVREAKRRCGFVVATIFVNPLQFNPAEDLDAYPRDEAADRRLLMQVGADLLFAPDVAEMYPAGFATEVRVSDLTRHLDGPFRPGHFEGVATVVTKLFNQAAPDTACFGEKDFQQLQVIRRFTRDLDLPIEIVGVPTVRESDGLAMSSRNRYLSAGERATAGKLPEILRAAIGRLAEGAPAADLLAEARTEISAAGFGRIDYLELCDGESLEPIPVAVAGSRVFAAVHLGRTRLIDNWPVGR